MESANTQKIRESSFDVTFVNNFYINAGTTWQQALSEMWNRWVSSRNVAWRPNTRYVVLLNLWTWIWWASLRFVASIWHCGLSAGWQASSCSQQRVVTRITDVVGKKGHCNQNVSPQNPLRISQQNLGLSETPTFYFWSFWRLNSAELPIKTQPLPQRQHGVLSHRRNFAQCFIGK